jgi:hypothetical protein
VAVFDPSGTWMRAWQERFAAYEIPCLRSPGVHHPHPDPYALARFATASRRAVEMSNAYGVPSTALFNDFCLLDQFVNLFAGKLRQRSESQLTRHFVWRRHRNRTGVQALASRGSLERKSRSGSVRLNGCAADHAV